MTKDRQKIPIVLLCQSNSEFVRHLAIDTDALSAVFDTQINSPGRVLPLTDLRKTYEEAKHIVTLSPDRQKIIGALTLQPKSPEKGPADFYLQNISVRPDYERQHIAKGMITRAFSYAAEYEKTLIYYAPKREDRGAGNRTAISYMYLLAHRSFPDASIDYGEYGEDGEDYLRNGHMPYSILPDGTGQAIIQEHESWDEAFEFMKKELAKTRQASAPAPEPS